MDGAIHRAAGPALERASIALAPCPAGDARLTDGFDLPARFVVHAVGPRWKGGARGEATAQISAYRARSIAFPAISTGVYGYPKDNAAPIAVATIRHWLGAHPGSFNRVLLVAHGDNDEAALRSAASGAAS